MSARGRLPTSNTFELIRKWKLVKEEEEKQTEGEGQMDGPGALPPNLFSEQAMLNSNKSTR